MTRSTSISRILGLAVAVCASGLAAAQPAAEARFSYKFTSSGSQVMNGELILASGNASATEARVRNERSYIKSVALGSDGRLVLTPGNLDYGHALRIAPTAEPNVFFVEAEFTDLISVANFEVPAAATRGGASIELPSTDHVALRNALLLAPGDARTIEIPSTRWGGQRLTIKREM